MESEREEEQLTPDTPQIETESASVLRTIGMSDSEPELEVPVSAGTRQRTSGTAPSSKKEGKEERREGGSKKDDSKSCKECPLLKNQWRQYKGTKNIQHVIPVLSTM